MDTLISLLQTLNSLSPLAVIALLAVVIFYQVKHSNEVVSLKSNDLHELPEMADTLRRIETNQATSFATIIEALRRMNGNH